MKDRPHYEHILPKLAKATVITAKDDPIVPYQNSIAVANQIRAKLICYRKRWPLFD